MTAPDTATVRNGILKTLRAGLAANPMNVAAPPPRPASLPVGPDAWERLAALVGPLDVRLRLAANPTEAARHAADIAAERGARSYLRWEDALDPLGLDAALAGLARAVAGPCAGLGQVDLGLALAHAVLLESGSIVLAAGPGRSRAASLVPPVSVIFIPRAALRPDVSALPELYEAHGRPACLNLVTGPSSTADIELVLVRGVHGPAALELVGLDWGE